jgi:hypothetical protein
MCPANAGAEGDFRLFSPLKYLVSTGMKLGEN